MSILFQGFARFSRMNPILDAHFQAKQMSLTLLNSEIFCVIIL
jgi:hypothetical protein